MLNSLAKLLLILLGFENSTGLLPGGNCCRWFWRRAIFLTPGIPNRKDKDDSYHVDFLISQFARLQVGISAAAIGTIDGLTMLGVASKDVLLQMLLHPTSLDDVIKPSAKSPFPLVLVKFVMPPWNFLPNSSTAAVSGWLGTSDPGCTKALRTLLSGRWLSWELVGRDFRDCFIQRNNGCYNGFLQWTIPKT